MSIKPVFNKKYTEIAQEWDAISEYRFRQIEKGQDLSFKYILTPTVFNLLENCDLSNVLDLGCGVGVVTKKVAENADHIVGIDISHRSIEIAKKNVGTLKNIEYINCDIESFAERKDQSLYTTIIAGMTLMTMLDLEKVIKAVRSILEKNGKFLFTITHPCYWPLYWQYEKEDWFNYKEEILIEANFKTSIGTYDGCVTTHIHRPLEMYFNCLSKMGFSIKNICEPMPSAEIEKLYPSKWLYPRFLGVCCSLEK